MTYCLGWKTNKGIILAADSAITSNDGMFGIGQSSFGESHLQYADGKIVEERALKIFSFDNLVLTYTGDVVIAHNIVASLRNELKNNIHPRQALNQALGFNINPQNCSIKIICGFYENDLPILLSFNAQNDGKFQEHEFLIQLGSIFGSVKNKTDDYLRQLSQDVDIAETAPCKITKLLSVLQSLHKMGPLMVSGVGGAFTAIYVDQYGSYWQPDILYVFHSDNRDDTKVVSVCIRNECLVVNSPTLNANRCLTYAPPEENKHDLRLRCKNAIIQGSNQHNSGKFNFVIIQNIISGVPVNLILEMNRKLKHEMLWIEPLIRNDSSGLGLFMNPRLYNRLQRPSMDGSRSLPTIEFVPYMIPNLISPIKKMWHNRKEIKFTDYLDGRLSFPE